MGADMLLGEEEAGRAYRRLQRLRAFRHGAAQLVAAVQAFLHSRIAGGCWGRLGWAGLQHWQAPGWLAVPIAPAALMGLTPGPSVSGCWVPQQA